MMHPNSKNVRLEGAVVSRNAFCQRSSTVSGITLNMEDLEVKDL